MKRIFLLISFFTLSFFACADEGMWLPIFLKSLNEADMKARGLKISADQIYSINNSSLKDAVVSFGGFCTGEVISSQGLILTNHHCGYGQIQNHSSVEKDYLTHGFWAMKNEEELKNPGLTATFIVRMEDVTKKALLNTTPQMTEKERETMIATNIKTIKEEAVKNTHYEAVIKPFFYGSEYYMFITETFKDIRLVGAPPSGIGKFGGDTDNWMWPRHTGDFSVFRIYMGKNGKPAEYNQENIPYKPKHYFPISLKGVNKGDFTMVMGFPGRTQEYLTSYAVNLITELSNPHKIKLRQKRLEIMQEGMKSSDKIRIQYAAKYASISNYHKKWIGENRGLKRLNAVEKKQEIENKFTKWVKSKPESNNKYGAVLDNLKIAYEKLEKIQLAQDYYSEAVLSVEVLDYGYDLYNFVNEAKASGISANKLEDMKKLTEGFFKDFDLATDKKLFTACLGYYLKDINSSFHPNFFKEVEDKYNKNFSQYADKVYAESNLTSEEKAKKLLEKINNKDFDALEQDPLYRIIKQFTEIYRTQIRISYLEITASLDPMQRLYVAGLRKMQPNKKFYPDANSTLRIAYGKVADYKPMDAVHYQPFTHIEGIMQKEDPTNEEFIVPTKLQQLYKNKDFGRYGKNGTLPVCFIASNHTTGGNSGSPVINAEGHLIGTNFDRNWEGTMSDIMYDPDRVRNIVVDIRYTLFVIDKVAGAGYLLQEMKIIQ